MPIPRYVLIFSSAALLLAASAGLWWWQGSHPAGSWAPAQAPGIVARQTPPPLHPVVAKIVSEGSGTPYLKLNYVIKEIPVDLAEQDVEALITFITGPRPAVFTEGEWGSLTNDIQEALGVQAVPNEKVARAFIATFRDEARTQLMRDYALQHIGGFGIYLVHTRHTRDHTLPPFFEGLTGELIAATSDPSKPWAGTALNLLDGLLRAAEYRAVDVPGVSAESLTRLALPIASNEKSPLNARLPALQLASRRGSVEALDLARQILADSSSPLMLVQASAAAIGQLGGTDDLPILHSRLAEANPHAATALREAISELSQR
jgi:hypothetical protein